MVLSIELGARYELLRPLNTLITSLFSDPSLPFKGYLTVSECVYITSQLSKQIPNDPNSPNNPSNLITEVLNALGRHLSNNPNNPNNPNNLYNLYNLYTKSYQLDQHVGSENNRNYLPHIGGKITFSEFVETLFPMLKIWHVHNSPNNPDNPSNPSNPNHSRYNPYNPYSPNHPDNPYNPARTRQE